MTAKRIGKSSQNLLERCGCIGFGRTAGGEVGGNSLPRWVRVDEGGPYDNVDAATAKGDRVQEEAQALARFDGYEWGDPLPVFPGQNVDITAKGMSGALREGIEFVRIELAWLSERPDVALGSPHRRGRGVQPYQGLGQCGEAGCFRQQPNAPGIPAKVDEPRPRRFDYRRTGTDLDLPVSFHGVAG